MLGVCIRCVEKSRHRGQFLKKSQWRGKANGLWEGSVLVSWWCRPDRDCRSPDGRDGEGFLRLCLKQQWHLFGFDTEGIPVSVIGRKTHPACKFALNSTRSLGESDDVTKQIDQYLLQTRPIGYETAWLLIDGHKHLDHCLGFDIAMTAIHAQRRQSQKMIDSYWICMLGELSNAVIQFAGTQTTSMPVDPFRSPAAVLGKALADGL